MSPTAKLLGIAVPVLLANTFCLTAPFMILVADAVVLAAAVIFFLVERREAARSVARIDEAERPPGTGADRV